MKAKNIILEQDECAPDSLQRFNIQFKEMFKIKFTEWRHLADREEVDGGAGIVYRFGNTKAELYTDNPYLVL